MENNIIVSLVNNVTILLSMALVYTLLGDRLKSEKTLTLVLSGFVVGVVGILLMSTSVEVNPGTFFDTRSVLLSCSGLFFGPIPTVISGILMIAYRITLGGNGLFPGILAIVCSGAFGLVWRRYRIKTILCGKKSLHLEFYLFGLLSGIIVLICMLTLPNDLALDTIKHIYIPILGIYPFASYLLSILIMNQSIRMRLTHQLYKSEDKYKSLVNGMEQGLALHEMIRDVSGKVIDYRFIEFNQSFEKIMRKSREELLTKTVREVLPGVEDYWVDTYASVANTGKSIHYENYAQDLDSYYEVTAYSLGGNKVAAIISDVSKRRKAEKDLYFLGYHDQLTGLYNRRFYEEELIRLDNNRNIPLTLAMGDVNGLKLINDSFGHDVGDMLLKRVAKCLKDNCRGTDVIARLGGDEFVIILPNTTLEETEAILGRIKYELSLEKINSIEISISFGIETKHSECQLMNDIFREAEDDMYRHKLSESLSMRSKTIDLIMSTLYEKNGREQLHSIRVSEISALIAINMNLSDSVINDITTAGLMHDIGKIGVHDNILNKSDSLDAEELDNIKRHAEIGYRILSSISEFSEIACYVLAHHERWDGTGYPKRLHNHDIPLESRIIAVADAYDAMTNTRTYKKVLSKKEAIQELIDCSGTYFDREIVDVFINKVVKNLK